MKDFIKKILREGDFDWTNDVEPHSEDGFYIGMEFKSPQASNKIYTIEDIGDDSVTIGWFYDDGTYDNTEYNYNIVKKHFSKGIWVEDKPTLNENEEYLSEPYIYHVGDSDIHGQGAFASDNIQAGTMIGLLHTILDDGYDFDELGHVHNHSDEPNCFNELIDNQRFLVAKIDIPVGVELTSDYTLQPDLEQPKDDWWGINENFDWVSEIPNYLGKSFMDNSDDSDTIYTIIDIDGDNVTTEYTSMFGNKKTDTEDSLEQIVKDLDRGMITLIDE